ncbi:hypothetical protein PG984_002842 [Apiospora sp. TS-2023a]
MDHDLLKSVQSTSPGSDNPLLSRDGVRHFAPGQPAVVVDASIWTMFAISTAFMALRFYCRASRSGILLRDDFVLAAGWASCHLVSLSLTKTSFAVTLIQITRAWQRYVVWFVIGSINIVFVIHILLLWRPFCHSPSYDLPISCWDASHAVVLNIFSSLYSSMADFVLALFPMRKSERVSIAIGMSFGVIAGVTGIMKAVQSVTTLDARVPDCESCIYMKPKQVVELLTLWRFVVVKYNLVIFWIFTLAEPNATIIAACIPVLRVLFRDATKRYYGGSKSPSTGGYIRQSNHHGSGMFACKDSHRNRGMDAQIYSLLVETWNYFAYIILSFTIQAGLSFILSGWSILIETCLRSREARRNKAAGPDGSDAERGEENSVKTPHDIFWAGPQEYSNQKMVLIDRVLKSIGNTQLLNGIALLIGALAQHETLGLYHFHIVYDVVNFTGVSAAAAIATTSKGLQGFFYDYLLITLYLSLHLAFTVLFGLKLRMWDNGVPGRCYNTDTISSRGAAHPYVDDIYIGITAFWLWVSMAICTAVAHENLLSEMKRLQDPQTAKILSRVDEPIDNIFRYMTAKSGLNLESLSQASKRLIRALLLQGRLDASRNQPKEPSDSPLSSLSTWLFAIGFASPLVGEKKSPYTSKIIVLGWAFIQYPVHGYMIYALRSSNEGYLSGNSENEWGFGQIVALVLVAAMLLECFKVLVEYILVRILNEAQVSTGWSSLFRRLLLERGESSGPGMPREHPNTLAERVEKPNGGSDLPTGLDVSAHMSIT